MHSLFFRGIRPGTRLFRRFEMLQCLDATSERGVFLCNDYGAGNRLAVLKVAMAQRVRASIHTDRLRNEAELSLRVRHPNVLQCLGTFADDTFEAYATEYVNGGPLSALLEREHVLDVRFSCRLLLDVAGGLAAIHRAGIIHRDLKPENVLLTRHRLAKIADFGIALLEHGAGGGSDEVIVGTVNYLSPEYIEYGRYDKRTDVYALGLIAFEMLCGRLPEPHGTPIERLLARTCRDAPSVLEFCPECPLAFAEVIARALARDPFDRFPDGPALESALLEALSMSSNQRLPAGERVQRVMIDHREFDA